MSEVGWAKKELERNRQNILTWPRFLRPASLQDFKNVSLTDLRFLLRYYRERIQEVEAEIITREEK